MSKKKIIGIYQILNNLNGKSYIGQSIDINHRLNNHRGRLNRGCHSNRYLQNSWNKYGKNNFEFNILEECRSEDLNAREKYYINLYDSKENKNGYNIREDACCNRGLTWSDERRKKMNQIYRNHPWWSSRPIPEETRRKAWESSKNRI